MLNFCQRAAPEPELRKLLGLINMANNFLLSSAEPNELRCDRKGIWSGVRILKAAGIGDESCEKERGDIMINEIGIEIFEDREDERGC